MLFLNLLFILIAAPAVLCCTYLAFLTLLSAKPAAAPRSQRPLRFDIVVPAHDEALSIGRVIASLQRIEWPKDCYRINVVADNCTDATASLAHAAGAVVWERSDAERRGKGYALALAFQKTGDLGWSQALVVVDADSEVSPNLLEACASRIESGARAIQVHYGVLNPETSWRTRLMTIAQAAFHRVRSRARERLGVSCGLRGNGWCVTHELLHQVPYRAYSLAEDVEYGISLGIAGIRVVYADDAFVDGEMVSSAKAAGNQRKRWENGRSQLVRTMTIPLLLAALKRRDKVCLDLAVDLLVLPLSSVVLNVALLALLALLAAGTHGWPPSLTVWIWVAAACFAGVTCYTLRGWQLSGTGMQGLADLAAAPVFLAWKILLMARKRVPQEWVRTDREKPRSR